VLAQGGKKIEETEFLNEADEIMKAGAKGLAVGRNIWQDKAPDELSSKLAKIVF
jgi:class I fructose-bisphosphate aldolase